MRRCASLMMRVIWPSGRWLAYSADPSLNTYGGLASGNVAYWNATYTGLPPSSVSQSFPSSVPAQRSPAFRGDSEKA